MTATGWARLILAGTLVCAALSGCTPGANSRIDEQHEPYFLAGQNLARQRDYQGAIDAFEKAVEANHRSASAHFELAWLYEDKGEDPAAAIYHYQRFLKLCQKSDGRVDQARDHIRHCTMELAKSVSALVTLSPSAQSYLEKLSQENSDLKAKVAQLEAFYAAHNAVSNNVPTVVAPSNAPPRTQPIDVARDPGNRSGNQRDAGQPQGNQPVRLNPAKTHTIQARDTMMAIAKQYGVSLSALKAANPRVDERNLRIGATLNIPAL
jgi:tetratricopeptide (TPR) repeat protein